MKTAKEIEIEAKKLFTQFENKILDINEFENKLIELSENFNFDETLMTHENFVDDFIKPQFNAYKESERNYHLISNHLLSVYSSGSLLNQFLECQE